MTPKENRNGNEVVAEIIFWDSWTTAEENPLLSVDEIFELALQGGFGLFQRVFDDYVGYDNPDARILALFGDKSLNVAAGPVFDYLQAMIHEYQEGNPEARAAMRGSLAEKYGSKDE